MTEENLSFDDLGGLKNPFPLNSKKAEQDAADLEDIPPVFKPELATKIKEVNQRDKDMATQRDAREQKQLAAEQDRTKELSQKWLADAQEALNPSPSVGLEEEVEDNAPETQSKMDKLLEKHPEVKKILDIIEQLEAEIENIDDQILKTRGGMFGREKAAKEREALQAKQNELEEQYDAVKSLYKAIVQSILDKEAAPAQDQTPEQKSASTPANEIRAEIETRKAEQAGLGEDKTQEKHYYNQEIERLEKELDVAETLEKRKTERAALPESDVQGRDRYDEEIGRLARQ